MNHSGDDTYDPSLTSWVTSANEPACDFPIQNLPFGRFRPKGSKAPLRIGVAIGDQVLDLSAAGLIGTDDMNALMTGSAEDRCQLRRAISTFLRTDNASARARDCIVAQADVEMGLPCRIGDYTDFYTSIHHATTVGKQFRPENPLLPNYKWIPIGYHGRASSIGVSGESFPRPNGQTKAPDDEAPSVGPTRKLDYELEIGVFIGMPNARGEAVTMQEAESRVFGLVLFNDWTARDIQTWEYQPLGPFLSKNFASTVTPWMVTTEALAPFRSPFVRPSIDPDPLPYLDSPTNREAGAFDIQLEVWLQTAKMREAGHAGDRLVTSNFNDAYWTVAQMVAHHTVNGCNLQSGDLFGTGTLSGPRPEQAGSLLELSQGGKKPIQLSNGEKRTFLEDGDSVVLRGYCERTGARRIGFGECRATVLPARALR
ncbi:MAG: fumarylacetoacetase [Burkholderiaceae bacterium]